MSCGKQMTLGGAVLDTGAVVLASDEPTADSPAITVASSGEAQGMFVVREGPKRGSRISLDLDRVTIGRHPESDIFLDDITVSRRHAEIHRTVNGFDVSDAGSLNGTYVNRTLVERAQLQDGDELQVGKFKLVFVALGDGE
ncbi:MAG: pSer/pThr/pTyr-binding forkhead associated (FHA) protein [Acidimicrobiales bacterium]|jgi:pSer/pThr/pTyr-binding forkhead associated (FHA) protein